MDSIDEISVKIFDEILDKVTAVACSQIFREIYEEDKAQITEIVLTQEELTDILMLDVEEEAEDIVDLDVQRANEKVTDFVKEQRNVNTTKKTEYCMKRFREWLATNSSSSVDVLDMDAASLNSYIGLFLVELKKKDGTPMEPDTITSYHKGIARYLKENNYKHNILTSEEFSGCKSTLTAKRRKLKAEGLGNRPNKAENLTDMMIEKMWTCGELGERDAKTVQNTLFLFLTQGLGFRGQHESRQMAWEDISVKTDEKGTRYLEFNEKQSKTRTGEISTDIRAFAPKLFATGSDRCPLKYYDIFAAHRPDSMNVPEAPFYLSVKTKYNMSDRVWYAALPMGKNTLGKIISNMAKKAGIEGKIVNHSLCKNTCQTLLNEKVPALTICQLTGHKNVNSLNNYSVANMEQRKEMSRILSSKIASEPSPAAAHCSSQIALPGPSTSGAQSARAAPSSTVSVPPKNESTLEKLAKASCGILSSSNIHGNVTMNFNYYLSRQQNVNVSPKPAIEAHVESMFS